MRTECDPVGVVEIAERAGVTRNTINSWIQREQMPPWLWQVGGRPAWNWPDIELWLLRTGRMSADGVRGAGRPAASTSPVNVWTTPVNYGRQTRYNFAGVLPHFSQAVLIDLNERVRFRFTNGTDYTRSMENVTWFSDLGEQLHDRYRLEVQPFGSA